MKFLPVTLLALALLGAAVTTTLYIRASLAQSAVETQLAATTARANSLATSLAKTTDQNDILEKRLTALDSDLGETKSRLTTSDARNIQLTRELAQAKTQLAAHEDTARALNETVAALDRDLITARASLASPEAVDSYKATISELERQLASAQGGTALPAAAGASTAVLTTRSRPVTPAEPAPPGEPAAAPPPPTPNITATVLSVGPDNAFVVLNCGAVQGAAPGQFFRILRGTDHLATVLISDVRPGFSIAQVQPDSIRAALHKGDSALSTR